MLQDGGIVDGGNPGEGEGEGEQFLKPLFVIDLVDGEWRSTEVPGVTVFSYAPAPAAAGELDGDGRADTVFGDENGVHVVRDLLGTEPSLEHVIEREHDTDQNVRAVHLEDLDQNGSLDLLVLTMLDWPRLFRGLGDGMFAAAIELRLPDPPAWLPGSCQVVEGNLPCPWLFETATFADLDGDGDKDLVMAGRGISVFRNDGGLVFTYTAQVGSLPDGQATYEMNVATAWRDGEVARVLAEGRWDWASLDSPPVDGAMFALASSDLTTWSVTGSTTFDLEESNPRVVRVESGFAGDAVACGRQQRVVDVDSAGSIALGATLDYCPLSFGDIDGDGNTDMTVAGGENGILFGDGAGGYVATELSATAPRGATLGDVNGDGDMEIIGFSYRGPANP
ncbi:MAG: hypothetical protein A2138_09570 [Deltaproteobacteria bacterium RBG_16_71_12]|nr:MAG: hypothetical protein A2138_09570 [Deltaproteobacteria bacterium RBG_16_71_12]